MAGEKVEPMTEAQVHDLCAFRPNEAREKLTALSDALRDEREKNEKLKWWASGWRKAAHLARTLKYHEMDEHKESRANYHNVIAARDAEIARLKEERDDWREQAKASAESVLAVQADYRKLLEERGAATPQPAPKQTKGEP